MKKFDFTKENWCVEPSDHAGCINVSFGEFIGGVECWYHHGNTLTKEEAESRAKLISAAPELLEMLIMAFDYITVSDDFKTMSQREFGCWLEKMQLVIQKATE